MAILANIDSKSRVLHDLIQCRIVHENIHGPVSRESLILILEDIASLRNHITIGGYLDSKRTQRDTVSYFFAVGQFVMLLMSIRETEYRAEVAIED